MGMLYIIYQTIFQSPHLWLKFLKYMNSLNNCRYVIEGKFIADKLMPMHQIFLYSKWILWGKPLRPIILILNTNTLSAMIAENNQIVNIHQHLIMGNFNQKHSAFHTNTQDMILKITVKNMTSIWCIIIVNSDVLKICYNIQTNVEWTRPFGHVLT